MPANPADGGPGSLLADLTARVPGARSAALVAAHGMVITEHGLGTDDADQLGAIVSVLWTHTRKASVIFGGEGLVRQMAVDGEDFMLHRSRRHRDPGRGGRPGNGRRQARNGNAPDSGGDPARGNGRTILNG